MLFDNGMPIKIPPVLLALLFFGLGYIISFVTPHLQLQLPEWRIGAYVISIGGVMVAVLAVLHFRLARTSVNPFDPSKATELITGGVYQISRNPMYLGLAMGLAAWALFLGSPLALLTVPAFAFCMNRMQIEAEEQALEDRFGEAYRAYKKRVRRWI